LPEIVTGRPQFGRWAPKLALLFWLLIIPTWIVFFLCNRDHTHHTLSIYGFFAARLTTIILFLTGLLFLAIEAISHTINLRRYREDEQALAASTRVPPRSTP
jgi:hypothetical protein